MNFKISKEQLEAIGNLLLENVLSKHFVHPSIAIPIVKILESLPVIVEDVKESVQSTNET